MHKILLIQSRSQPERIQKERENFTRAIGKSAELEFLSALDTKLSWTNPDRLLGEYDGVIFGGSSDFDFNGGRDEKDPARIVSLVILSRVRNIISHALTQDFPLLGVCFGHQIIAEMRGGEVKNDSTQEKVGSYKLALTEDGMKDRLFGDFSEGFFAQYDHKDSATKLPEGAVLIGGAPNCRFAALRYGKKGYTMQFHPEMKHTNPDSDSFHESPKASRILPLWIERIVEARK
jgi:GMP synthase (glutamine-hydrolysing)